VRIAEDHGFIICYNPKAAERRAAIRARMIAQLTELTSDSDWLGQDKRAELRGVTSTKRGQPGLAGTTAHRFMDTELFFPRAAPGRNCQRSVCGLPGSAQLPGAGSG